MEEFGPEVAVENAKSIVNITFFMNRLDCLYDMYDNGLGDVPCSAFWSKNAYYQTFHKSNSALESSVKEMFKKNAEKCGMGESKALDNYVKSILTRKNFV